MIDAYAAGIIDGEGCITIAQHGKGQWFSIRIDVGMSDKSIALLEALKQNYGGSVRQTREATEKWEASSAWGIFGKEAAAFLMKIEQYLFLKAEQARLALRLQEILDMLPRNTNGSAHWTDEARQRGSVIRLRVQELNRKGPDTTQTPEDGWFARLVAGRWVTPQQSMFADLGWEPYSETWPRSGMTRNGSAYRRPPLVRRIDAIECSLWPTPRSSMQVEIINGRAMRNGKDYGLSLPAAVKLWPTPSARDWRSGKASEVTHAKNSRPLNEVVRLWSTPTATRRGANRDPTKKRPGGGCRTLANDLAAVGDRGELNPTWVEWLMGFPPGWTDLED